jgi:signal transduction histidine kinase
MSSNSIQKKLTSVVMTTTAIVLLFAGCLLGIQEFMTSRRNLRQTVLTSSKIIAANSSAALAFRSESDARETLATLRAKRVIVQAGLYDQGGSLFAAYSRESGGDFPEEIPSSSVEVTSDSIIVFEPVMEGQTRLGTLYVKASLEDMYRQLMFHGLSMLFIMACALFLGYLLSRRLQRKVSAPIYELDRVAETVSQKRDYSVRAKRYEDDELGRLTDTFNQMLGEIQDHVAESRHHAEEIQKLNEDLENKVRRRTSELASANKELLRSNAELEQFAYVASHDLQEPLRMVGGFTRLLADEYKGKLDVTANEYIEIIVDGATRMHRLVNDLLDFSRVGRGDITFSEVNLNEVLVTVRQNLARSMEESGAVINAEPLPVIVAEPSQMSQLLQNLVGNAIKFRRKNEPPTIEITIQPEGSYWKFTVKDNGIGIKPDYAEKIFLIFQRLHTRDEYPGTGIGLAICKKIVERHRGRIWVESEPGKGSTFHFTINRNLPVGKES